MDEKFERLFAETDRLDRDDAQTSLAIREALVRACEWDRKAAPFAPADYPVTNAAPSSAGVRRGGLSVPSAPARRAAKQSGAANSPSVSLGQHRGQADFHSRLRLGHPQPQPVGLSALDEGQAQAVAGGDVRHPRRGR